MRAVRTFGIILAIGLIPGDLLGGAAIGQVRQEQPTSALKGHNSSAPVDVTADRIEVQDRADRAIFAGNVHATQAELTLDTQRLTVAYSNAPQNGGGTGGQSRRLEAGGGGGVASPSRTAEGGFGIYDPHYKTITGGGDGHPTRGPEEGEGQGR